MIPRPIRIRAPLVIACMLLTLPLASLSVHADTLEAPANDDDCALGHDASDHGASPSRLVLGDTPCKGMLKPSGADEDWYVFAVSSMDRLTVRVERIGSEGWIRVCLYAPNVVDAQCENSANSPFEHVTNAPASGDWRLHVATLPLADPADRYLLAIDDLLASEVARGADWRYQQTSDDLVGDDWAQPAYADEGWAIGSAAFGGDPLPEGGCPQGNTTWEPHTHLYLRRAFFLETPRDLDARVWIDNNVEIYLNGEPVLDMHHDGGCVTDEPDLTFVIPAAATLAGVNLIAVHAVDEGLATYFDMEVR